MTNRGEPYFRYRNWRDSALAQPLKSGLGLQPDTLVQRQGDLDMSGYTAAQNYARLAQQRSQHMLGQK